MPATRQEFHVWGAKTKLASFCFCTLTCSHCLVQWCTLLGETTPILRWFEAAGPQKLVIPGLGGFQVTQHPYQFHLFLCLNFFVVVEIFLQESVWADSHHWGRQSHLGEGKVCCFYPKSWRSAAGKILVRSYSRSGRFGPVSASWTAEYVAVTRQEMWSSCRTSIFIQIGG